jgi:hypothetical protein
VGEVGTIWVKIGAKIDEFERSMSDAQKAMEKVGRKFNDVGKQLSIAGGVIVGAMGLAIKKTADWGDSLDNLSQKTGISVEALSRFKLACDKSDISLDQFALGMRGLSAAIVEAQKPGSEAARVFEALGIKTKDINGNLRDSEAILLDVADRFSKMENGATKTKAAVSLFSRAGMDMIHFLNMGKEGLRENAERTKELGLLWSTAGAKGADEFSERIKELQASVGGTYKALAQNLIPALTNFTIGITTVIGKINLWIREHPTLTNAIMKLVGGIGLLLTTFGGILIVTAKLITAWKALSVASLGTASAFGAVGIAIMAAYGAYTLLIAIRDKYEKAHGKFVSDETKAWAQLTQQIGGWSTFVKNATDKILAQKKEFGDYEKVLNDLNAVWDKYGQNTTETLKAIASGKEGQALKKLLDDLTQGHASALFEAQKHGETLDDTKEKVDALAKEMQDKLLAALAGAGEKTKSWNEELGVTTKLDLATKIALMEQALVKYGQQMPISEQARLTDEIKKAKDELAGFNIAAQVTLGLLPNLREKTANLVATFDSWLSLLPNLRKEAGDLLITWEDSASKMEFVNEEISTSWDNTVNEIRGVWQAGLLEMLRGTKTFGDLIQNMFSTIGSAVSESIFKAFTKAGSKLAESLGAFAGPIGAALGAVAGSLISLIGGLFEKKPKKTEAERMAEEITQMAKEEIATLAVYGKVSEDTAKKIAEARQAGMAGYAAISKYFADIIRDTGVTGENINKLWQGAGEIIDHIRQGALSAADGIKSLGDSFTAMLEGAKKLGQEGSKAMVDFILKIRASGLEVPEVTKYVLDQLGKIPAALATIVNNMYMPSVPIKTLQKELDKLTEKLKGVKEGTDEWKTITARIKEIQDELGAANKAIPKTTKELDAMGRIAVASFQAMLANGKTFIEALAAMKGPLQGLLDRYKALGIKIPEYLKPLLHMQALSVKFRVEFENMSAAIQILDSLRNSAYLTQATFNSLVTVVNDFARAILGIKGSINAFMNTAKLTQTQIQTLLPIVAQFAGAAAIFGLTVPAWMKTFVTKQLGVDWKKFQEKAAEQASAGIATVEKLKTMLDHLSIYDSRMKDRFYALRTGIRDKLDFVIGAIKGLPHAQSGGVFTKPSLVHVAERGPEVIIPLNQLAGIGPQQVIVEIQPIVIPRGDKYIIEFLQKSIERGNLRIPITAVG